MYRYLRHCLPFYQIEYVCVTDYFQQSDTVVKHGLIL